LKTSKVLCKNLTCNKFEKYLEFLRFLKKKEEHENCFFWGGGRGGGGGGAAEVFSKRLNVAKYESCLHFFKGCLKETKLLQNIKIV
jgi:hypothetical protein